MDANRFSPDRFKHLANKRCARLCRVHHDRERHGLHLRVVLCPVRRFPACDSRCEHHAANGDDPREQPQGGIGQGTATKSVHWTRFLHVPSDELLSSEWAGAPRCRPVLNNLLGLQKVYCSSPEMWWQAALYGLAFNTHPQLGGDVDINIEETKDQVENYLHDQMCSGAVSLQKAQTEIATNWLAVYNSMPAQYQ